ncbi:hypothetical protein CC1G_05573 [Coprinopsis cinerea okayama7|uniref:Uncharacterized protein n=1 Tax=Coprinopsis cinerea (strain Okayama-7 / 130 / ATCC MYA-4618 / FGSC 9003) TaxID=240176 RepID=A8P1G7_COPC7|nr:hypothetical protein CC1G_05573 [Coprinopsis cinerea okayama7\|eukprot:XP_001838092.1 hypothetical protein CC1G_05573 [Coprinopsis cinerea okayama7\
MQFTSLISTLTVALIAAATPGAALNYRSYSSTVSCSGPSFGCSDGGAVCCGPMPAGFGFSAQFDNLAAGTQGQGYTDQCRAFLFAVFGPGTRCWNGGGARANYLNWFHSAGRVASSESGKACVAPTDFEYEDGEGVKHAIKVPVGNANATEVIAEHYRNKNWAALAAYEAL